MTTLVDRWVAAARGAGATADDADLAAAGEYLLTRWSEPQRQYHTVAHLTAVLDVIDGHAELAPGVDRVRLAAWLHDAVYDPRALGDANERDSAEFAAGLLATLGAPDEVGRRWPGWSGSPPGTPPRRTTRTASCSATRTWRSWRPSPEAVRGVHGRDPPGVRARAGRRLPRRPDARC